MRPLVFSSLFLLFGFLLVSCGAEESEPETSSPPAWQSLFDGKTLDGWIPKIRGYATGENFGNTFRVADGVIQANFDSYEGDFNDRFGHLFYETPFSSYRFRMKYRFTGEQAQNGPDWAWRNSGIMLHCQDPKSMAVEQDFPLCIEVQLLGGREEGERSTGNLCTPGSHVVMGDSLMMDHCLNSTSATYRGDQWVNVMVEVFSDSLVRHIIEGDTVMTYYHPQVGGGAIAPPSNLPAGTPMTSGWISIQSESHPVEFKEIEIMDLAGI